MFPRGTIPRRFAGGLVDVIGIPAGGIVDGEPAVGQTPIVVVVVVVPQGEIRRRHGGIEHRGGLILPRGRAGMIPRRFAGGLVDVIVVAAVGIENGEPSRGEAFVVVVAALALVPCPEELTER